MNTIKTPTLDDVARAVRNADRDARFYDVDEFASCLWFVTRKDDRSRMYTVSNMGEGETCDCKAFEKSAVCKHQVMVRDEKAVRELESLYAYADEADLAAYAGRW